MNCFAKYFAILLLVALFGSCVPDPPATWDGPWIFPTSSELVDTYSLTFLRSEGSVMVLRYLEDARTSLEWSNGSPPGETFMYHDIIK